MDFDVDLAVPLVVDLAWILGGEFLITLTEKTVFSPRNSSPIIRAQIHAQIYILIHTQIHAQIHAHIHAPKNRPKN